MDRIQNCQEKFEALFGGKPTQNEGNDPEFMRILQRFIFGEVSYTGSLDDKMRELITVTVLTVNQTLPQLKAHVGACPSYRHFARRHPRSGVRVRALYRLPENAQRYIGDG